MEEKLRRAIEQLETAIAADACSDRTNWAERREDMRRAVQHVHKLVMRPETSAMDKLSAKRMVAALLTPEAATAVLSQQ